MAIVKLTKDAKCRECGAVLKAGTTVKAYKKSNGEIIYYGFHCHARKASDAPAQDTDNQPKELATNAEDVLREILSVLRQIRDHLLGNIVVTEQVLNEAAKEATNSELTQKDWARFWATARNLGFDKESVHALFQTQSLKDKIKTKADLEAALQTLKEYAAF